MSDTKVTGGEFITAFMQPLVASFRAPDQDTESAKLRVERYFDHLKVYPVDVLGMAILWFERTRRDPFLPTIAECIEACEREVCRRERRTYVEPGQEWKRQQQGFVNKQGWVRI